MNILSKLWKKYADYPLEHILSIYDEERLPLGVRHHILSVSEAVARILDYLLVNGIPVLSEDEVRPTVEGSLLHDIGRAYTHGIYHALVGAAVALDYGYTGLVLNIIRNHIGAGIKASEAIYLGLPYRDYVPQTFPEKLVACVDNMAIGPVIVDKLGMLKDFQAKVSASKIPEHVLFDALRLYDELSKMIGADLYEVIASYGEIK